MGASFAHRFGRRLSLGTGTIITAIGVALCLISTLPSGITGRRAAFLVAKIVQGVGIGQILTTVQTYISEIVPPRLRGPAMSLLPLFTMLGQLIGAGVIAAQAGNTTSTAYFTPLASQLAFTVPPLLIAAISPESPVWLLEKERRPAAEKSLLRLRRADEDLTAIADNVTEAIHKDAHIQTSFADCFKGNERRRTMIVLLAYISPQFWGVTLMANASYFAQVLGMEESLSLLVLVAGIVFGLLANVASIWTLANVRRRKLILWGLGSSTFIWIAVGVANCFANTATLWYDTSLSR
jgi:MFS family permease